MTLKRFFVDRIEDGRCFLEAEEGGALVEITSYPEGVAEGDCLIMTEDGFSIDEEYTKNRRKELAALKNRLFGKD